MKGSLYAPYVEKGIIEFCEQHHFPCKTYHEILPERIQAHEAYLILNSQLDTELIELVTKAQAKGYTIGKDIGIISYNESQLNEVILNGLTVMSTDFIAMGKITAQMILDKQMQVIHCPFGLILRKTL
jgi:DNA-binding LacI/PurR family transcriptional regulator